MISSLKLGSKVKSYGRSNHFVPPGTPRILILKEFFIGQLFRVKNTPALCVKKGCKKGRNKSWLLHIPSEELSLEPELGVLQVPARRWKNLRFLSALSFGLVLSCAEDVNGLVRYYIYERHWWDFLMQSYLFLSVCSVYVYPSHVKVRLTISRLVLSIRNNLPWPC